MRTRLWLSCEMEPEGTTKATGTCSGPVTPLERFNIEANGLTIEMVLMSWSTPPPIWQAIDAATYERRYGWHDTTPGPPMEEDPREHR